MVTLAILGDGSGRLISLLFGLKYVEIRSSLTDKRSWNPIALLHEDKEYRPVDSLGISSWLWTSPKPT